MKILVRSIIAYFLLFEIKLAYGFVGGAHGGFSGGGAHGSFFGAGYHNSNSSTADLWIFVAFFSLIIGLPWAANIFDNTRLGKIFHKIRQDKYIKKCKHTPVKPKRSYTGIEVQNATESLKHKAMKDVRKLHFLSNSSHHQIAEQALISFEQLQKAWVDRNTARVLKACNNVKYSKKLSKQIEKMTHLDVYNFIDKTQITECHFVKCYKPLLTDCYILRFVMKGEQIDEYTTKKSLLNTDAFKMRVFNCLVDVVPYKNRFKIYQVKIDQHTDDYVIKSINNGLF